MTVGRLLRAQQRAASTPARIQTLAERVAIFREGLEKYRGNEDVERAYAQLIAEEERAIAAWRGGLRDRLVYIGGVRFAYHEPTRTRGGRGPYVLHAWAWMNGKWQQRVEADMGWKQPSAERVAGTLAARAAQLVRDVP